MNGRIRLDIGDGAVQAFADLTGDRSSLHVDPLHARTTQFRGRVAHGMLPLAHLACLPWAEAGARALRRLSVQFLKPLRPGDAAELRFEQAAGGAVQVRVVRGETVCTQAVIQPAGGPVPPPGRPPASAGGAGLLAESEAPQEERWTADRIAVGHQSLLSARGGPDQAAALASVLRRSAPGFPEEAYARTLRETFIVEQLLAACLVSTYTGMRMPGRHATLVEAVLEFDVERVAQRRSPGIRLHGVVGFASATARLVKSDLRLVGEDVGAWATGKVTAQVDDRVTPLPSWEALEGARADPGLRGKVAVVTGASRGVGAAVAKALAVHGMRVAINYLHGREGAEALAAEINARSPGSALPVQADVSDKAAVDRLVKAAVDRFGSVHVLVNNAVTDYLPVPFLELDEATLQRDLDVMVKGAVHACQAVLPFMVGQKFGRIIQITSSAVAQPAAGHAHYVLAKSALTGLVRSLAVEFGKENVTCNLVMPGLMETDLTRHLGPTQVEQQRKAVPLQRLADLTDVANAVVYLASSLGGFVNGQKIVLTGGAPPML